MRPASIVNFERIVLLLLALSAIAVALDWDRQVEALRPIASGSAILAVAVAIIFGVYLLLMWLIARRRSVVAKWIYVVLTVLSLAASLPQFLEIGDATLVAAVMTVVSSVLGIVSIYLLFRPDTRGWFGGTDDRTA
jgi:hypothetical protein